ncbi:membrane protein [Psychromicrobium lacuslunae]|uniref:Membrane protein n=1 Tax=Psychromicrobium lacuslunae TaxID=1618207 RepID=A0A0D4C3E0_9MICC|nr:membrane protein [Psychromicrobium lacuslunae]
MVYALIADLILVLVFAAIGRASHQEDNPVIGVLNTAWPFLAGLLLGWLVGRVWRAPLRIWPHGVCLWLITVLAGMVLRVLSGKTAEFSFILVASAVLGIFLLAHRALASLILRRRSEPLDKQVG